MSMPSDAYSQAIEQIQSGELLAALESLNRAIAENPEFADALYQRAQVRVKLKDLPGAIADYSTAIQLQPTAEALLNRAWAYLISGTAQAALIDAQQTLRLVPNRAEAYQILGSAYRQLADVNQAIAAYKQAARHYIDQRQTAAAQFCITQVEQLSPPQVSALQLPVTVTVPHEFIEQAIAKAHRGNLAAALVDFDWLLHLDPNQAEALCQRAMIHAKLNHPQLAVQDLARAIAIAPTDRQIRLQRGIIRLLLKDAQGAIADFSDLMRQEPEVELFAQRGHSYRQLGDWENAFKDYSNALSVRTEAADLFESRAEVQKAMSEFEGAIADYQQAAKLWFNQGNWKAHQQVTAQAEQLEKTLKQHAAAREAARSIVIRVPIKYHVWGIPVIEVLVNNYHRFDMALDTGAAHTVITHRIAQILAIQPSGTIQYRMIDGSIIQAPIGWIESISVGKAIAICLQVAIADDYMNARLGQDFLRHYDIRILENEIEFQYRSL